MDQLALRDSVDRLMREYGAIRPSRPGIDALLIVDSDRVNYLLLYQGWDGARRVHHIAIHIELKDDKIWLQCDNTDLGVAETLVERGAPRDQIVLGFREPMIRPYTGFAAG